MLMIIDRYVSKLFLGYFFGGLIVFLTLFFAIDFMSNFSRLNAPMDTLAAYYLYRLPEVIYQMIPVGCLIATVFTLSNLNKANELVALFSAGMSLARISAPILVLVTLISALSFWAGDRVLPYFSKKKNYTYYVDIKKNPSLYSLVKTNKIWFRSGDVLFHIKTLIPQKRVALGTTLYYFDETWRLMQLITAKKVVLDGEKWHLRNGSLTVFAKESSFPLTQKFDEKTIIMGEDIADLSSSAATTDILSIKELEQFIRKNKDAGLDTLRYEVDYHSKFGFAFAAFVMSILGIPFSLGGGVRSGGAVKNIGLCILVTFLYWSVYQSFITLGRHGAVPPLAAAWTPNISMVLISIAMLVRLKK